MEAEASNGFSTTEPGPAPDRRQSVRYTRLLRVGVIDSEAGKELCLVRNISDGGLMARVYSPRGVGTKVRVELKCGCPVSGTVLWAQEPDIGIQFDQRVDVRAVLQGNPSRDRRPRLPRLEINRPVTLRIGSRLCRAVARNISQGGIGAQVALQCPRSEVVVSLPGLDPIRAAIRWSHGDQAGIAFNQLLPLPVLMGWLVQRPTDRRE